MRITNTNKLNTIHQRDLENLLENCRRYEPVTLSFPIEDASYFLLLYDNQNLLSAISLFFPDNGVCECMGATQPAHRSRGYFHRLFNKALEQLEEDTDIYIITDNRSPDAMACIQSMEFDFWYSEYMMTLSLHKYKQLNKKNLLQSEERPRVSANSRQDHSILNNNVENAPITSITFIKEESTYYACIGQDRIGSCSVMPQKGSIYLYRIEIKESLRNRGYGTLFFHMVLLNLASRGNETVSLQVSGLNLPAMALYQKTGFQITETLSYYLY